MHWYRFTLGKEKIYCVLLRTQKQFIRLNTFVFTESANENGTSSKSATGSRLHHPLYQLPLYRPCQLVEARLTLNPRGTPVA